MANLLQSVAFEIKQGRSDSGIIDCTQFAPVALYPVRIPDGGCLMPVGAPRLTQELERGNGPLDFYPIAHPDGDGVQAMRLPAWDGEHGTTPTFVPLAPYWRTIPHLVLLAVDDQGEVVPQAEDTVIYAVCEVRR